MILPSLLLLDLVLLSSLCYVWSMWSMWSEEVAQNLFLLHLFPHLLCSLGTWDPLLLHYLKEGAHRVSNSFIDHNILASSLLVFLLVGSFFVDGLYHCIYNIWNFYFHNQVSISTRNGYFLDVYDLEAPYSVNLHTSEGVCENVLCYSLVLCFYGRSKCILYVFKCFLMSKWKWKVWDMDRDMHFCNFNGWWVEI